MATEIFTEDWPLPQAAAPPFEPPTRVDLSDFFEEPPAFDFVMPGMVAGTVGALVSPGGAGKSMLALQVASTIAGAADLLELEVKKGRVVYLPAEDPSLALWHRLHALSRHWEPEQRASVKADLDLYPLIGLEPNLLSEKWFAWIESLLDGSRVLFLDTLRRFHQLEENASGDMARVVGRMEAMAWRRGCSIVFLHHSSKAAAMQGQGDQQQASRGSSVLVDNVRWQAFMAGMTKGEAEQFDVEDSQRGFFVRFGVSKQNYGQPFAERWFRRHEGGVLMPAVLKKVTVGKRAKRKPFNE